MAAGSEWLAAGSPYYRGSAQLQVAGGVSLLQAGTEQRLVGAEQWNSLGTSLTFLPHPAGGAETMLAVGQPASDCRGGSGMPRSQAGSLLIFPLSNSTDSSKPWAALSGDTELGRFGQRAAAAWQGGLLVSAPYHGLGLHNHGKVLQQKILLSLV